MAVLILVSVNWELQAKVVSLRFELMQHSLKIGASLASQY